MFTGKTYAIYLFVNDATQESTDLIEAMGAKISIKGPPRALYLVIGNKNISALVTQSGGQITMRFALDKLLAVLSYEKFLALKNHPDVSRIGPVNLDMERFKRLSENLSRAAVLNSGTA